MRAHGLPRRWRKGIAAICLGLAASAMSAPLVAAPAVPPAANFAAEARAHPGSIWVILFSLPGCRFCEDVRRAYLPALTKDDRLRGRVHVREVEIGGSRPLVAFNGERTTQGEFASSHGAKLAPTVLFLGAEGQRLAPPLVGGDVSGFYGSYLDQRVAQALGRE